MQYHQWVRAPAEGGAQSVLAEGAVAPTQGQVTERLPPAAGLLRRPVPGERPILNRTRNHRSAQVLAKSSQS